MNPVSKISSFLLLSALFLISVVNTSAQGTGSEEIHILSDTVRARVMFEEAKATILKGSLDSVFEKTDFARRIYTSALGAKCKEVADSWHIIGVYLLRTSKWDDAIEANKSAINIRQSLSPTNKMDLLRSYNNLGQGYLEKGQYNLALENFIAAKKMLPDENMTAHPSLPVINMNIANAYVLNSEYEKATNKYNELLDFYTEKFGNIHPQIAVIYNNLGAIFLRTGNYQNSINYFKKGLQIRNEIYSEEILDFAQSYSSIGLGYQYIGDKLKALEYLQHAISIYIKFLGEHSNPVAQTYGNIGTVYSDIEEYDKSIEYHQKALSILTSISGDNNEATAGIYNNLGRTFELKNDLESANEFMQKALSLNLSLLGENHFEVALSHSNLGIVFHKMKDYDQAEKHLMDALKIRLSLLGSKHSLVANCYHRLSMIQAEKNKMDEYYRLKQLTFSALNYTNIDSLKAVNSMIDLISFLSDFSVIEKKQFLKNNNVSYLHGSVKITRQALTALDYHCFNISTSTKNILAAAAAEISTNAIATNQHLYTLTDSIYYLHESFDYAERSKAYLLYEAMQEANALHIAGIPDSLLDQEYDLRVEIAYFDKRKQEKLSSGTSETDSTVLTLGSKLFDLNRIHETLIKTFETQYPHYYKAKYSLETAHVSEVQAQLTPQQTLLEYVIGDSSIFLFLIQNQHFEVFSLPKDFPLEKTVDSLTRHGIYGYYALPVGKRTIPLQNSVHNYTAAATLLYQKLLQRVENQLTEEVIIIPDGVLGYVPFEALLTKSPGRVGNFKTYDYWVAKHRISYCYSATLLREMREKKHQNPPQSTPLVLAPFYRGDTSALQLRLDTANLLAAIQLREALNPLEFSGEEAASIAKIWSGHALFGPEASLTTFLEKAPQHRMLHLSTHGKADDRVGDYAYLALGDPKAPQSYQKLYARDLYNLQLNADLVILSACETALGRLRRGEGITSLARAFAYAGAKSLVTSLWKVDDAATKDLLVDFHRNLRAGKAKDAALHQAKTQYLSLKSKGDGAEMHPFFWAGFIAIGDMRAIR